MAKVVEAELPHLRHRKDGLEHLPEIVPVRSPSPVGEVNTHSERGCPSFKASAVRAFRWSLRYAHERVGHIDPPPLPGFRGLDAPLVLRLPNLDELSDPAGVSPLEAEEFPLSRSREQGGREQRVIPRSGLLRRVEEVPRLRRSQSDDPIPIE